MTNPVTANRRHFEDLALGEIIELGHTTVSKAIEITKAGGPEVLQPVERRVRRLGSALDHPTPMPDNSAPGAWDERVTAEREATRDFAKLAAAVAAIGHVPARIKPSSFDDHGAVEPELDGPQRGPALGGDGHADGAVDRDVRASGR